MFLKDTLCGDITYGRQPYDYQEGTIVCFAPGQVASIHAQEGTRPTGYGLLFHPDFIRGTQLGHDIRNYSFFSYEAREALHLSEEERHTVIDCLHKIDTELRRPADKHSRRLITANIGLLLDYCMRFYERQFITRSAANKDILMKFEALIDDYFQSDKPQTEGLPSVKYFADKVFLSSINVKNLAEYAKENNSNLVVTGYADSATGSAPYNQKLSEKRAETVANELVKMGVSRDQITTEGKGGVNDLSPVSYNRRATVKLAD